MSINTDPTPTGALPVSRDERLVLANQLFREFHTRCFWHCPCELVITEDLIPMVVEGLSKHGGRRGFMMAGELRLAKAASRPSPTEEQPCR